MLLVHDLLNVASAVISPFVSSFCFVFGSAVFIINPENKLMLSLNYPACVGRNMDEIVRCVQALQLSYEKSIATPANWPNNHGMSGLVLSNGRACDGSIDGRKSLTLLCTVSLPCFTQRIFHWPMVPERRISRVPFFCCRLYLKMKPRSATRDTIRVMSPVASTTFVS